MVADLTPATAELPPDDPATAQKARIEELTAIVARQNAELARFKHPLAEDFQIPKNAAKDSGVPRQTLEKWVELGKVKHKYDDHGQLWIDVIDARRQRFALAPGSGKNGH